MSKTFELKKGMKLTPQDMANFMEITYKTYCRTKQKKLKEFELFADYHLEPKDKKTTYVVVDKVINPTYSKAASDSYEKIKAKLPDFWAKSTSTYPGGPMEPVRLDSCRNVSIKIQEYYEEAGAPLTTKYTTNYSYTCRARTDLYGRPYITKGSLGYCKRAFCKKDTETGTLYLLTKEEHKKKNELLKLYFGAADEKTLIIKEMIERGEITKEQAWEEYEALMNLPRNYKAFLKDLADYYNRNSNEVEYQIVQGTIVYDEFGGFHLEG